MPRRNPCCTFRAKVYFDFVPVNFFSLFTAFKKLKILATSQQQGTTFRIMFQLKRYEESVFHTIPGVAVLSNPIEVYSHTYYLPNKRRNGISCPSSFLPLSCCAATHGNRIYTACGQFSGRRQNSPPWR